MIREQLYTALPRRFLQRMGFRLIYSWALLADATLEAMLQGMAARLPGLGTETALSRISRDRRIRRGFVETSASFSARVIDWLTAHKKEGSAFELMRQVQGYLGPLKPRIRHVWTNGELGFTIWRTLNSDGTTEQAINPINWDWDGDDLNLTFSSRAWLIIYSTPPNNVWDTDGTWDDTAFRTWDEDEATVNTWGTTATLEQISGVRDIVKNWKAAKTFVVEILIAFDNALFDPNEGIPPNPDGNWRYYSKEVAGVQVLARAEDTVYWEGVG